MANRVGNAASRARFNAILLGVFGAIAMVLSAIGIYGVVSYTVRQRTREIGIRVALGARSEDVVARSASRRSLDICGNITRSGGCTGSHTGSRDFLYEVKPDDPQRYLLIAVLLAGVALLASYVPARRASVIDPAITLRTE
jgi:putative ABC transport system permease protein